MDDASSIWNRKRQLFSTTHILARSRKLFRHSERYNHQQWKFLDLLFTHIFPYIYDASTTAGQLWRMHCRDALYGSSFRLIQYNSLCDGYYWYRHSSGRYAQCACQWGVYHRAPALRHADQPLAAGSTERDEFMRGGQLCATECRDNKRHVSLKSRMRSEGYRPNSYPGHGGNNHEQR